MSLSRDQIIRRAALELVGAASARSQGPLADAARQQAGTPEPAEGEPAVALLDVTRVAPSGAADVPSATTASWTVGLTLAFDACSAAEQLGTRIDRLVGPFGVVDVCPEGLVIVEVALNVSARDLQEQSTAPLLAGPGLGPVQRASEGV